MKTYRKTKTLCNLFSKISPSCIFRSVKKKNEEENLKRFTTSLKMYGGGTPRLVNLAARGDANRKHHYGWSGAVDNPEMCSSS